MLKKKRESDETKMQNMAKNEDINLSALYSFIVESYELTIQAEKCQPLCGEQDGIPRMRLFNYFERMGRKFREFAGLQR